mgnify:CR=1 FL=1
MKKIIIIYIIILSGFTLKAQESKIIVNKETGFTGMSAQERQVWMQDVELGNIPKSDYYDALRRAGLIDEDRTNEELISESDTGEISNA